MNDMLFQITNPGVEEKAIQLLEDQFHFQMPWDMKSFVYYIFSEFLDEFLEDPDGNGYIAGSFTEFLEKLKIIS